MILSMEISYFTPETHEANVELLSPPSTAHSSASSYLVIIIYVIFILWHNGGLITLTFYLGVYWILIWITLPLLFRDNIVSLKVVNCFSWTSLIKSFGYKIWTLTTLCTYILFSLREVEVESWRVLLKGQLMMLILREWRQCPN